MRQHATPRGPGPVRRGREAWLPPRDHADHPQRCCRRGSQRQDSRARPEQACPVVPSWSRPAYRFAHSGVVLRRLRGHAETASGRDSAPTQHLLPLAYVPTPLGPAPRARPGQVAGPRKRGSHGAREQVGSSHKQSGSTPTEERAPVEGLGARLRSGLLSGDTGPSSPPMGPGAMSGKEGRTVDLCQAGPQAGL